MGKMESEKVVEMTDNKHSEPELDCASSENSWCDQMKPSQQRQLTDLKALLQACQCDDSGCSSVHASSESLDQKKTPHQQMVDNLKVLVQACQCDDADCSIVACENMKKLVNHSKECEDQTNGGCSRCKLLFVLCCYHARSCHLENCSVIHCTRIKGKMRHRRVTSEVVPAVIASLDASIEKDDEITKQEDSDRLIEQSSESLLHAMQCKIRPCTVPLCAQSKLLLSHVASCRRKANGGCKSCIRAVKLVNVHAKNCQNVKCKIPLCLKLKDGHRSIQERNAKKEAERISVKSSKLQVSSQVRKNSVSRLVLTMCPSADLTATLDEKTRCQFNIAQKLEEGIFKRASSDLDYQKLIVKTIRDVSEAKFLVTDA